MLKSTLGEGGFLIHEVAEMSTQSHLLTKNSFYLRVLSLFVDARLLYGDAMVLYAFLILNSFLKNIFCFLSTCVLEGTTQ